MTKMLIYRSLSFFMLLAVVLVCQQTSTRHVMSNSPHRKQTASYAIDDESTIASRVKVSVLLHRVTAVDGPLSVNLFEPPIRLKGTSDLVLSRQATKTYTLHLLSTQTHSSVT
jgi:hypothetical protein